MVPAEQILKAANDHQADIIGLSGLITPSLDEMCYVAEQMNSRGMELPLLIGGATTSRTHTALKIEPEYTHSTVWVKDASRAVGVVQQLLSEKDKNQFCAGIKADYHTIRERRKNRSGNKSLISLQQARDNALVLDWDRFEPVPPSFTGVKVLNDITLSTLRDYIDWTPFFQTWELHGRFPDILQDELVGESARSLFADAQQMLDQIIAEDWLQVKAILGFFPAQAEGDDVLISHQGQTHRLLNLRQQVNKPRANLCLSDFIAPAASGKQDHIGAFAVSAGMGIEPHVQRYEAANDDYNSILLKALADRLAEACAEYLHQQVRTHHWGHQPDEQLDNEALIKEDYKGIRPAPGYPACPDHTQKELLFDLLDVTNNTGIELTEGLTMYPAASVSGFYYAHPESQYFVVGKINAEQLEDYARRKGVSTEQAKKALRPNLED
jgi:5-methyltetrahydrofolate--homocysteine methyltransferase